MEQEENTKPKRGRPKQVDIDANKKGQIGKGKVGRPPGMAARIEEFKARLLSTSGEKVINKIVETAMTDGHPAQSACMKMCIDRILPISFFDKEKNPETKPIVTINISSTSDLNPTQTSSQLPTLNIGTHQDIDDADYTETE